MFNSYIGILKFLMSLLVVAIHVKPFSGNIAFYYNDCIARIADPVFFTLSSYFLFDKLLKNNWDFKIYIKHLKHLLKYYFIWLLVFSPLIIMRTLSRTDDVITCIYELFKQVFLSGPYGALWFLPALLLGLMLTYLIGKRYGTKICLFISFPFFFLTIIETEYYFLIKDIAWIEYINEFFITIFGWLGNGINYGFFFCSLGLFIASQKQKTRSFRLDIIKLILSILLLVGECTIIRTFHLGLSYGAMFFLIPVSYYLMYIVLNLNQPNNIKIESISKYLQNMSLLIFPLHYGIMEVLEYLLQKKIWYTSSSTLQYIIVILITCIISALILKLAKKHSLFKIFYGK